MLNFYMARSGVITTVFCWTTEEQSCCIQGQRQELTAETPLKLQFITKTTKLTVLNLPALIQRQVSISAAQELRGKIFLKDSSRYNNCTVLNIKCFRLVCSQKQISLLSKLSERVLLEFF